MLYMIHCLCICLVALCVCFCVFVVCQTTADYGYYYSDPTAANGVSTSCSSSNQYSTIELYPTAPALR